MAGCRPGIDLAEDETEALLARYVAQQTAVKDARITALEKQVGIIAEAHDATIIEMGDQRAAKDARIAELIANGREVDREQNARIEALDASCNHYRETIATLRRELEEARGSRPQFGTVICSTCGHSYRAENASCDYCPEDK